MNMGQRITKKVWGKILDSLMPGGMNWTEKDVDCLKTCPSYKCCVRRGPDHTICSENWARAIATYDNLIIVRHVLNEATTYDCGDLPLKSYKQELNLLRPYIAKLIRESEEEADGIEWEGMSKEGRRQARLHQAIERCKAAIEAKKASAKSFACEACPCDFGEDYGGLGRYFCECHHIEPLSKLEKPKEPKLEDFALLCSNCHRMVHRLIARNKLDGKRALAKLKAIVKGQGKRTRK